MTIASDPINTMRFTNYTIHIDTNPSNRLWRQCFQQNNGLDGSASLFTPNRIQSAQNPNTNYHLRNSNTLVSYYILLWCYLHSLATRCCFVMLAVTASQRWLRSSYTKAFSRSAESLSKTFKLFPSAADSYVLLAELHYNILACFI